MARSRFPLVLLLVLALLLGTGAALATASNRTTVLVQGDGGDTPTPQDDIQSVSVYESPASAFLTFNVTVGSTNGTSPQFTVDLFLTSANGSYRYSFAPSGGDGPCGGNATCSTNGSAPAYSFHVPTTDLGVHAAGDQLWNIWVGTYEGFLVDRAPGSSPGIVSLATTSDNVTYALLGPVPVPPAATNATQNGTAANESFQSTGGSPANASHGVPGFPATAVLLASLGAAVLRRRR